MLSITIPEPLQAYIDALVHPAARLDPLTTARHRAFIGIRLFGGLTALAAMPLYFAFRGAPTPFEAIVLAWFLSPLIVVWYLSRTGNFERAHLLSACLVAGLVVLVTGATGGVASFAVPWLAVIPLEAALSASRRAVNATIVLAISLALGLWAFGALGWLPAAGPISSTHYLFGLLSAMFYTGAISLGAAALARSGERVKQISEARYHLLAQNMIDVITRHGRNGAVTFVSPAAEQLVCAPAGSLMGYGLFDRVHVADRPSFLNALAEAACGRPTSVEYRLRRGSPSDGEHPEEPTYIWVESRCRSLAPMDEPGRERGGDVVAVTRDITRLKNDAIELEDARAEAERANQAKSRFLATVSHELRTPLNAIIGFSEMLQNESKIGLDLERRMDYARLIHESGQHLLAVVNGILDVSRIETGHFELNPERFDVGPLVERCFEMMLLRAEQAGVGYRLDLPTGLPEIVADKLALRQVLINLVSNAIKFTPRGGSVDVSVRPHGNELLLTVSDTGIGIAEEDLAQLGHPFFQARSSYDRPYEGTGLGLSVVKGLVELHGGRLEIRSRVGEGTRVTARMPRTCNAKAPVAKRAIIERLPARPPAAGAEPERMKRRA